jgi:pyruvate/2-oxoglutarate dehydrogenase complex dihydrolipoamide acyltransferase (E2) component
VSKIDLTVPDLGNFDEVAIVDVLVKVGDKIEIETPLVTLETDKATMDVPSTAAGTVTEVLVQKGGKIAKGGLIARIEGTQAAAAPAKALPPLLQPPLQPRSRRRLPQRPQRRARHPLRRRSRRNRSSPTCRTIAKPSC